MVRAVARQAPPFSRTAACTGSVGQDIGEVRVGVQAEDKPDEGRPVADCDPIIGDQLDYTVTWKGSSELRANPGSKLRLFFKLRAAELFGAEWV